MPTETLSKPTNMTGAAQAYLARAEKSAQANGKPLSERDIALLSEGVEAGWRLCTEVLAAAEPKDAMISLPRAIDEDLYYIVGGAMGAQSPEQCDRADGLWDKLVARADRDANNRV